MKLHEDLHEEKLHEEVVQMSMTITMPSTAKHAPVVSQGVPYDQQSEEDKARWFYIYAGIAQKWTSVAKQPLSETTLKDTDEGKS